MRIISGYARGKKLDAPQGMETRPTHDRTREALFNILQRRVAGAQVLDLFAGSGALALEAISRGAQYAVLCDISRAACAVIEKNAQGIWAQGKYEVLCMEYGQALQECSVRKLQFSLVFLDPPYHKGLVEEVLPRLLSFLTPNACIVAETSEQEQITLPEGWILRDSRKYGKNLLHFIEREVEC